MATKIDLNKLNEISKIVHCRTKDFIFTEYQNKDKPECFQKITIKKCTSAQDVLFLETDKEGSSVQINGILKKDLKEQADFVILVQEEETLYAYIVDCKSNFSSKKVPKAINQIEDSVRLIKFLLLETLNHQTDLLDLRHFKPKGLILHIGLSKSFSKTDFGQNRSRNGFDLNKNGQYPITVKQVGLNSTHTFDDFLSYFKTA
jgi:hypothetical protein